MSKIISWNETVSDWVYGPRSFWRKRGDSIFKIINFVFRVGKGMNNLKLTELLLVFIKLPALEENV